jgi:SecD/SecF fusion protein
MKKFVFVLGLLFIFSSCNWLLPKKNNKRYLLELNTREFIITLAAENNKNPDFWEVIFSADSLKKIQKEKRYSELFFAEVSKHPTITLQTIFVNKLLSNYMAGKTSNDEIKQLIEREIADANYRGKEILLKRISYIAEGDPVAEQIKGTDQLILELFVLNPKQMEELITMKGKIEFLNVYTLQEIYTELVSMNEYLVKKLPAKKETIEDLLPEGTDMGKIPNSTSQVSPLFSLLKGSGALLYALRDTAKINSLFTFLKTRTLLREDLQFVWGRSDKNSKDSIIELIPIQTPGKYYKAITGVSIAKANVVIDQVGTGFEIDFSFNPGGANDWKRMTRIASSGDTKKRIAIVLDNACLVAPTVQEEIPNGNCAISGNLSQEEAKNISSIMNSGMYPVGLILLKQEDL